MNYALGSIEREALQKAIKEMQSLVHKVPCVVNGEKVEPAFSIKMPTFETDFLEKYCSPRNLRRPSERALPVSPSRRDVG